jgi:ABC-type glycerol-3-phosphate transport system permease component
MRKLLQLVFGDARTVVSVALALGAAYGLSRIAPAASGALLVIILTAAAAAQSR